MTVRLACDAAGIRTAVEALRNEQIVAVPTETVYGLAGRADSNVAVQRIYEAKGRPPHNPLIVHVTSLHWAAKLGHFSPKALELAGRYWPGPLTLVVPLVLNSGLADAVTAGLDTVALRMPDHAVIRSLLNQLRHPLAAPSANSSGSISPTTASHALRSLRDRIPFIVDGGSCATGLESTILAVIDDQVRLLRPGVIDLGLELEQTTAIEAPGQLLRHYAPRKPLRLDARDSRNDEFLIGFGSMPCDYNLSPRAVLTEAAARLFAAMHEADESNRPRIAVAPVPKVGAGLAINDRLARAAQATSTLR